MSIFNLESQNNTIEYKIIAGLERLSMVFKTLIWEESKKHNLSPIQIQILIFVANHSFEKNTISYLAQEFNVTKPTISDAVKILEQKNIITKNIDLIDSRSYSIELTEIGKKIVDLTDNYPKPLLDIISKSSKNDKEILWDNLLSLIIDLNQKEIINLQRTCYNCKFHLSKNKESYCRLMNQKLEKTEIRIDCSDFVNKNG